MWLLCGKPGNGGVFDLMKNAKYKFNLSVRHAIRIYMWVNSAMNCMIIWCPKTTLEVHYPSDFRNFRNYCSPSFFDWSTLYTYGAVWIDLKIEPPTHICAQRNYFRFAAAILETDGYWLGQSQTESTKKHVGRHGNRAGKPLSVC